jgi:hypothetical protein
MPPPMAYLFAMCGYPRGADDLQRAYWVRFHPKGRFFSGIRWFLFFQLC